MTDFAIKPTSSKLLAPDGTTTNIDDRFFAFNMETIEGLGLLVQFGIETEDLDGEGFKVLVKVGQKIMTGDAIIEKDDSSKRHWGYTTRVEKRERRIVLNYSISYLPNGLALSLVPYGKVNSKLSNYYEQLTHSVDRVGLNELRREKFKIISVAGVSDREASKTSSHFYFLAP